MSKDELIRELVELRTLSEVDPEVAHINADELLLHYIDDEDVSRVFNEIEKWYA